MRGWSGLSCVVLLGMLAACGGSRNDPGLTNPGTPPPTDTISGTVTFNGAPMSNATVILWNTNANVIVSTYTTAADGQYHFSGLSTGGNVTTHYNLWAMKSGYGFYPSVGSGATVTRFDHTGNYTASLGAGLYLTILDFYASLNNSVANADFAAFNGTVPRVTLAATGQSTSYAAGDDGALAKGVAWPSARFHDNSNGTITDALTGLVWLKDAGCLAPAVWAAAVSEANGLANGQCGLSDSSKAGDWRLPNVKELESLIDVSASSPALSVGHPFANVSNAIYWSATSYFGGQQGSPNAWSIRMSDDRYMNDSVSNAKSTALNSVWAVKGSSNGAAPLASTGQYVSFVAGDDASWQKGIGLTYPRFLDEVDGTVMDTMTGLRWLKQANCLQGAWSDALTAVAALANGQCGLSDGSTAGQWRMPNCNEMQSLEDRMETNHADAFDQTVTNADGSVFQAAVFNRMVGFQYYWTSSTDAADTSKAWTVFSCDFGVYDTAKSATGYTMAVR